MPPVVPPVVPVPTLALLVCPVLPPEVAPEPDWRVLLPDDWLLVPEPDCRVELPEAAPLFACAFALVAATAKNSAAAMITFFMR